jgi:hypothetical protein
MGGCLVAGSRMNCPAAARRIAAATPLKPPSADSAAFRKSCGPPGGAGPAVLLGYAVRSAFLGARPGGPAGWECCAGEGDDESAECECDELG